MDGLTVGIGTGSASALQDTERPDRRTALGQAPADPQVWRDWRRPTDVVLDEVDVLTPPPTATELCR